MIWMGLMKSNGRHIRQFSQRAPISQLLGLPLNVGGWMAATFFFQARKIPVTALMINNTAKVSPNTL
jgi:hypothetical protein